MVSISPTPTTRCFTWYRSRSHVVQGTTSGITLVHVHSTCGRVTHADPLCYHSALRGGRSPHTYTTCSRWYQCGSTYTQLICSCDHVRSYAHIICRWYCTAYHHRCVATWAPDRDWRRAPNICCVHSAGVSCVASTCRSSRKYVLP